MDYTKSFKKTGRWKYVSTKEMVFEVAVSRLPAIPKIFSNKWVTIYRTRLANGMEVLRIAIAIGYAWDGCTGVPDFDGTVVPSAFHDALYQFCKEIALWYGWTEKEVLDWADEVFFISMEQNKANVTIKYMYWLGVHFFGYGFHSLNEMTGGKLA